MPDICILTDSTAQFPAPIFPGRDLVHVIPLHIQIDDQMHIDGKGLRASDLPITTRDGLTPQVFPPSVEEFEKAFRRLGKTYPHIIAILLSSHLNQSVAHAREAAENVQGHFSIEIVDSQTTSIGLGLLIQIASKAIQEDLNAEEIIHLVRGQVPHIYSVFCIKGLTYLNHSHYLDASQALVGELLEVMPFFILDSGRLVSTHKVRNHRHMVDSMHEFICEFNELLHVAILQGVPPFEQETRALRDRINEDYPQAPISEHTIGAALASIIGPRSLGLFIMEEPSPDLI